MLMKQRAYAHRLQTIFIHQTLENDFGLMQQLNKSENAIFVVNSAQINLNTTSVDIFSQVLANWNDSAERSTQAETTT